jgi:hypothetical protein
VRHDRVTRRVDHCFALFNRDIFAREIYAGRVSARWINALREMCRATR